MSTHADGPEPKPEPKRKSTGGKTFTLASPPAQVAAVLNAQKAADRAEAAAKKATLAASRVEPRAVVIGGSSQKRPRIHFTAPVRAQYLDLLRRAIPPHRAARELGITPKAVSDAKYQDPDFAEAVRFALEEAMEPAVEAQYRNALEGDLAAAKWLGEFFAPHIYSPKRQIDVKVDGQIESVEAGGRAAQIERIKALEERLATRLALRAAGDEIEAQIEEADLVDDAPQIEDSQRIRRTPQIEGADPTGWGDQLTEFGDTM